MIQNFFPQILMILVCNIGNLSSGFGFGYTGPFGKKILEQLRGGGSLSFVAASVSIGGLFGCLLAGKLANYLGRKKSLSVSLFVTAIGWLVVSFSTNIELVLVGTILHGIGEGLVVSVSIIYLGEAIEEKYSGTVLMCLSISAQLGITLAFIFGDIFTWRISAGVICSLNFVAFILSLFFEESQEWKNIREKKMGKFNIAAEPQKSRLKLSFSLTTCMANIIPPLLLFLFPIGGFFSICFYSIYMIENMGIGQPNAVSIGIGLFRAFGIFCGALLVERLGRRRLLILSSGSSSFFLASISFLLISHDIFNLSKTVLDVQLIALLLFSMFSASFGMAPVPWILCGEWPCVSHKAPITATGSFLFYASVFLSSQQLTILEPLLGLSGMFLVFSGISALFLAIVLLFVPDTRGKSLEDYFTEIKTKSSGLHNGSTLSKV